MWTEFIFAQGMGQGQSFGYIHRILKRYCWLWHVCLSVRPSVWNSSAPTGWILMKFDIWVFFRKYIEQIQVSLKSDKNSKYFAWKLCMFLIISDWILRMSNVLDKCFRENQNTHFMFSNFPSTPPPPNRVLYEVRWSSARIYNTYCFAMAAVVMRTHLSVIFFIRALPVLCICVGNFRFHET
jgi:hypothetical protein